MHAATCKANTQARHAIAPRAGHSHRALCKGLADVTRRGNSPGSRAAKRDRMDNDAAKLARRKHWFPDPSAGKRGRRRPLGFPCRTLTGAGSPLVRPASMRVFGPQADLRDSCRIAPQICRHFTGEPDGCIGELVAAELASRRGLGRALANAWARGHGLAHLTLHSGTFNTSAAPSWRPGASPRRKSAPPARQAAPRAALRTASGQWREIRETIGTRGARGVPARQRPRHDHEALS